MENIPGKVEPNIPLTDREFRKARMTNWYQPTMLLNIALKAVISGTFGNYADKRELEAALIKKTDDDEWGILFKRYRDGKKEIWLDIVSDTGDGFNSTFSIAKTIAAKDLTLKSTVDPNKH